MLLPGLVHVVVSDPPLRRAVQRCLELAGHRTEAWATAADFIAALPRLTPGCIICDHEASGVDGFAVLTAVQARSPALPVVMMVFCGDYEIAVSAMRQGVADVVEKPVTAEALLAATAQAVEWVRALPRGSQADRARLRLQAMTGAEDRLLQGLAAGRSPEELAREARISVRTLERRSREMVVRLGVGSIEEAVSLLASARV